MSGLELPVIREIAVSQKLITSIDWSPDGPLLGVGLAVKADAKWHEKP